MKKILLFLCLFIAIQAHTQTQPTPKPQVIDTTYIKGKAHPVYLGARGGQYIIVISKTGTTYKKYLPKKPVAI